jgi:hypothetical protein
MFPSFACLSRAHALSPIVLWETKRKILSKGLENDCSFPTMQATVCVGEEEMATSVAPLMVFVFPPPLTAFPSFWGGGVAVDVVRVERRRGGDERGKRGSSENFGIEDEKW